MMRARREARESDGNCLAGTADGGVSQQRREHSGCSITFVGEHTPDRYFGAVTQQQRLLVLYEI
jgi:hypothetical protein